MGNDEIKKVNGVKYYSDLRYVKTLASNFVDNEWWFKNPSQFNNNNK